MTRRWLAVRPAESLFPTVPFGGVDKMMRDMMRVFDDFNSDMGYFADPSRNMAVPRGDFYRKDGKIFAEFELPGIDPNKVELNVYADRLELKAEKSDEKQVEENNVFRSERYYGTVSRSIQFPVEVDPDSAKASFKNGVLRIEIREKVQTETCRKISIKQDA